MPTQSQSQTMSKSRQRQVLELKNVSKNSSLAVADGDFQRLAKFDYPKMLSAKGLAGFSTRLLFFAKFVVKALTEDTFPDLVRALLSIK